MTDSGDRPASVELALEKYDGLLIGLAGEYARVTPWRIEPEDLIQIARIALLEAYDSYDPERGVLFLTHLRNIVKYRFADYHRDHIDHLTRHARKVIPEEEIDRSRWRDPLPVDWADGEFAALYGPTRGLMDSADDIDKYALARYVTWLREQEVGEKYLIVLALYLDEFTLHQIGQVLNLTESRVSQMFKRLTDLARIFGTERGFRVSSSPSHA